MMSCHESTNEDKMAMILIHENSKLRERSKTQTAYGTLIKSMCVCTLRSLSRFFSFKNKKNNEACRTKNIVSSAYQEITGEKDQVCKWQSGRMNPCLLALEPISLPIRDTKQQDYLAIS